MSDERGPETPEVPDNVGDTGVQRALGERRRRRLAERSGQVDLDATMSHWPVTEPPANPRPVVRPARPSVAGVATGPVLPPPGHLVVGALLESRRNGGDAERTPGTATGERRERRRSGRGGGPGAGMAAAAAAAVAEHQQDRQRAASADDDVAPGAVAEESTVAGAPAPPASEDPDWEADLVRAAGPRDRRRPQPDRDMSGAGDEAGDPAATGADGGPRRITPRPTPTAVRRAHGSTVLGGPTRSRRLALRSLRWPPGRLELALAAAVLAVVLLVVALLVGLLGDDGTAETVQPVPDAPAQQTLAVTLAGADGGLAAAAVVGVDSAQVSTLLLPANLLLTVADAGEVPLSQAVSLGADSVRRGLEDTLLLRMDSTVLLQPAQLSALVDAVGGVVVDVGTEVVTDDVVVTAGQDQRLSGAQAATYASLSVEGEPVEAGLARFGAVLGALLDALPDDPDEVAQTLADAEVTATVAGEPAEPAQVLAAAAERSAAGNGQAVVLPTTVRSAGGAERRGVDEDAARDELQSRFAGALLPVAAVGEVRVLVRNGDGAAGLVGQARDRLVAAGLRYVGGGNAPAFDQEATVVLVPSQDDADRDRGEAVAAALGVGPGSLQVNSEAMVDIDVVVVLGGDFVDEDATDPTSSSEPTPGDAP